ncbi:hypothetical protein D9M70_614700 [compost metagenome]
MNVGRDSARLVRSRIALDRACAYVRLIALSPGLFGFRLGLGGGETARARPALAFLFGAFFVHPVTVFKTHMPSLAIPGYRLAKDTLGKPEIT